MLTSAAFITNETPAHTCADEPHNTALELGRQTTERPRHARGPRRPVTRLAHTSPMHDANEYTSRATTTHTSGPSSNRKGPAMPSSSALPLAPLTQFLAFSALVVTIGCGASGPIEGTLDEAGVLLDTAREALLEVEDEFGEIEPCPPWEDAPEVFQELLSTGSDGPYRREVVDSYPDGVTLQDLTQPTCWQELQRAEGLRASFSATIEHLDYHARAHEKVRAFLATEDDSLRERIISAMEVSERRYREIREDRSDADMFRIRYNELFGLTGELRSVVVEREGGQAAVNFFGDTVSSEYREALSARGKSRQIRADRVDLSGCSVVDFTAWRWARGRRLDRRHRCG